MACFTVPLAEAIVVSAVKAVALNKHSTDERIKMWRKRIGTLQQMLYGGSFLLAIEHIYHGEVVLYPPFLTAMNDPEEIPVMLHELATNGVGMALLVTGVWAIGTALWPKIKKLLKLTDMKPATV